LADFKDKAYHPGVGFWMHYGYEDGEPFYFEEEDERKDEDEE
jgi:hypothetical protein